MPVTAMMRPKAVPVSTWHQRRASTRSPCSSPALSFSGFDSYLFGSIASIHPVVRTISKELTDPETHQLYTEAHTVPQDSAKYTCALIWTQGMPASAMLAVGGILLLAGLGWTTTQFAKDIGHPGKFFACLGNFVTFATAVTSTVALADTALTYARTMASPPIAAEARHLEVFIKATCLVTIVLIFLFTAWRSAGLWFRRKRSEPWGNEADLGKRYTTLAGACFLTVVLSIGGPIWVHLKNWTLYKPTRELVWLATASSMLLPCLIAIFVAYTVPGPPTNFWKNTKAFVKGTAEDFRHAIREFTPLRDE